MLQRKASLEPRIEHPVWKNKVRCRCAGVAQPRGKADVLPEAVHDDVVVISAVFSQPGH